MRPVALELPPCREAAVHGEPRVGQTGGDQAGGAGRRAGEDHDAGGPSRSASWSWRTVKPSPSRTSPGCSAGACPRWTRAVTGRGPGAGRRGRAVPGRARPRPRPRPAGPRHVCRHGPVRPDGGGRPDVRRLRPSRQGDAVLTTTRAVSPAAGSCWAAGTAGRGGRQGWWPVRRARAACCSPTRCPTVCPRGSTSTGRTADRSADGRIRRGLLNRRSGAVSSPGRAAGRVRKEIGAPGNLPDSGGYLRAEAPSPALHETHMSHHRS